MHTSKAPPARAVELLVIGASTGGPSAVAEILRAFPADLAVPVLVAQHMPRTLTRLFAERLDKVCPLKVREGVNGARIARGDVWILPGAHHSTVVRAGADGATLRMRTRPAPDGDLCAPSVDRLFFSAADAVGAGVLAVVLSGMGDDGAAACAQVRAAGGRVVVQDAASSVVWGMPGTVVRAGLADDIVPLGAMARALIAAVTRASGG